MYCTYCNHPNADGSKYCESCGQLLVRQPVISAAGSDPAIVRPPSEPVQPIVAAQPVVRPAQPMVVAQPVAAAPPMVTAQPARTTSWSRRLASIGSMIVLYCFFLPWILVSCSLDVQNKSGITISGYEIASGSYNIPQDINQFGSFLGAGPSGLTSTNSAYPILALIPVFAALGLFSLNGRAWGSVVAILAAVLGISGMALFTVAALAYGNELSQSMLLKMQFRAGFWGTWFGFIWLILAAIMTVRQRR